MYDSYYSTLRSYISMQPVQTDKPVQTEAKLIICKP